MTTSDVDSARCMSGDAAGAVNLTGGHGPCANGDPAPTGGVRWPAQPAPFRVIRHMRPLYFHDGKLYCSRFNQIVVTADFGQSFEFVGTLATSGWKAAAARPFPLLQRVLRAGVYRMRVLEDGTLLLVFRGGIYTLARGATAAAKTFAFPRGNRPISLASKPGGLTVVGEYWGNPNRDPVHVYGSEDGTSWHIVSTFPAGSIRHVHGISYDAWDDCFWVCTGDDDHETGLLRASADFRRLDVVRQGGQIHRFYSILVRKDHLLLATDTPRVDNFVCRLDKRSGQFETLQRIENSSFYSCDVAGRAFVSTVAEPSPCNDQRACHVWANDGATGRWRRVLSFPVDRLDRVSHLPGVPKGLFQYPRIFFPEGTNDGNVLVGHCTGLNGLDNSMVCYDVKKPPISLPRAAQDQLSAARTPRKDVPCRQ